MRILHTAATYAPSLDGVAEVVHNISERLVRRGHEVHVATIALDSWSSYVQLCGVHVHRFAVKGNLATGMEGEVEKYRRFVRLGDWDLVVNHCLQTWATDALLQDLKSHHWASILVTHGLSGLDNPIFLKYYCEIAQHLKSYLGWITITNSGEERIFARRNGISRPRVITNGVNLEEWSAAPLGLRRTWKIGNRPWIVNVSNHNPLKGHRTLFRLAKSLKPSEVNITLIGGTHPMAKWGLGNFGARGGCFYECSVRARSSSSVDLKTNIPRKEVVSAIQEADLVVSTSSWEANSITLLESMAAGTPWISFDVGSASENIGGVVATDLDKMADAIANLLRNPERRRRLAAMGRARAAAKHDWEFVTDQYERIYERICAEGLENPLPVETNLP